MHSGTPHHNSSRLTYAANY